MESTPTSTWAKAQKLSIAIGSSGWVMLFLYLSYEYYDLQSLDRLLDHITNPQYQAVLFHFMIFAAPFLSSILGYLVNRHILMRIKLQEYSKDLEKIVESRTRELAASKNEVVEQKLKIEAMLTELKDGVIFADASENLLLLNAPAAELLGFSFQ